MCKECGGNGLCEHRRRRSWCKDLVAAAASFYYVAATEVEEFDREEMEEFDREERETLVLIAIG